VRIRRRISNDENSAKLPSPILTTNSEKGDISMESYHPFFVFLISFNSLLYEFFAVPVDVSMKVWAEC
jgi:hypothetical protein